MTTPGHYIGIDVAKAELVVATTTAVICRCTNDRSGQAQLVQRLTGMRVEAVVLESTGVLWAGGGRGLVRGRVAGRGSAARSGATLRPQYGDPRQD